MILHLKKILSLFLFLTFLAGLQSCEKEIVFPKTDLADNNVIPKPLQTTATYSGFNLNKSSVIYNTKDVLEFDKISKSLSKEIEAKIGLELAINNKQNKKRTNNIYIEQVEDKELKNAEAYKLSISKDSIILSASSAEGAFRGIQTLIQLIPETSNDTLASYKMWLVPTGQIIDKPNFKYRGFMLDVARHFFSVEEVKKQIDILAYYKINMLHLHLSDDQGWRIEIKSWPKLTTVGGLTEVGGGKGGFYSQDDYKELVAYAAERFITIIPEIDMPGHTNAASVSYPQLNGNAPKLKQVKNMDGGISTIDVNLKPYMGTEVGFSTFDANKEDVYEFIDDVVREIAAISPGPYFHIGGDESHVTKKKDYILFINKVEKIVQNNGKIMIGWDEITQASIGSTTIAQHWEKEENAVIAAKKGLKVILSPGKKAYLDMQYDTLSKFGLHWAAYIPVATAYNWIPESYIKGLPKENILGIEAPLWSETISNSDELEYLAYPRLIGYAELGWSTKENLNWKNYRKRLAAQKEFLDRKNIKYYPSKLIDW